ncbi:MAG TPA: sulfurtransferase TusA family protein [Spirochaetota bacterium]|nr:sulfurtransferase TusA family protein [Spirochaetota bacterium]HOD14563.1 sulfurtransferase TusA family protein [Spirochaetota bacterium]HPG49939.1 sulfurtransferase TusA family protein [Spirochaetota bacterium]HPN11039.1 sulfurtransferase TusA family protein [Spirochaetota bacterium]HQL80769.1 sulfurtransferase TusA family protein [Spirochaetota bacterium]
MSQKTIDARGLSCPQPVVLVQKAINEGLSSFDVIVNSEVARENVSRILANNQIKSEQTRDGDDIIIKAVK